MEKFKNGNVQKWKSSKMKKFKNGKVQKWKNSKMEKFKNGKVHYANKKSENGKVWKMPSSILYPKS